MADIDGLGDAVGMRFFDVQSSPRWVGSVGCNMMTKWVNLKVLSLSNSGISRISSCIGAHLKSLSDVYIANSKIRSLPTGLGQLPALRLFDARNLNLAAMPNLASNALQHLHLSGNAIDFTHMKINLKHTRAISITNRTGILLWPPGSNCGD